MNETELIRSIQQHGNQSAFAWLVRRYQSPLRAYLRRMLKDNVEAADDLAQECFLKAYSNIQSFRFESKFSTWLFQIARRLYLDQMKSKAQKLNRNTESLNENLDGVYTPQPEHRPMLQKALAELDTEEREILILNAVEEFSHQEIAEILECPLGSVKTRLKAVKEKLREILGEKR